MSAVVASACGTRGVRIEIRGVVQGVGFRPWVYRLATELGLAGWVRNDASGVTIEAFGPPEVLDAFVARLQSAPPPAARIRTFRTEAIRPQFVERFAIAESDVASAVRRVSIPPDLATCPACEAEIFDPTNRRYRYPFTNCTDCGPRFTITRDVPYDRPATSMAVFTMCPACQREYDAPGDRRFHAQPNACPRCGPHLMLLWPTGRPVRPDETARWGGAAADGKHALDPIEEAARALKAGLIVAVKGIGGFHLACDATQPLAVRTLRLRKRRDEKPFAVMVRDLAAAEALAELDATERALLSSVERPIVLARRRAPTPLAEEVAPRNPLVGLLLPYSPLHHLLLAAVARPLVMTSGNLSEEPLAYENAEALARLGGIADLFLLHNRDIVTRADDSVARVIAGRPVVLRRSRGYVPRPVPIARPFAQSVLAVGGHLKNTFCIGVGDGAYFGPHVGDLDNVETYLAFTSAIARLERFLQVRPQVIAHDLHPEYLSTHYARQRPEPVKVAVQHHHAHVASAMAEHGLAGPVIGVAYDGTGYGPDGTAWGGEILLADYQRYERAASFAPLPLPGGDRAIRQVWRIALAAVDLAFGAEAPLSALALFQQVTRAEVDLVRRMIRGRINTPLARGVGRYFDALGALVLARPVARYEGQIALELNLAADTAERGRYPFELRETDRTAAPSDEPPGALTPRWTIDLAETIRAAVRDLVAGTLAATISARFHNTLVAATAESVRLAAGLAGRLPVVLTGGVFQNALLTEALVQQLGGEFAVYLHEEVPPGDGGLALGQAVVADAVAR